MKLYKDYTKEPFSFFMNDTILPSDLGRIYYKMAVSRKSKTIDNKMEQNKAQYDLHRQTAKISASSSRNILKLELLDGEDVLREEILLEKLLQSKDMNTHQ